MDLNELVDMLAEAEAAGLTEEAALITEQIKAANLEARKAEAAQRLEAGKQAEADKLGPLDRALASFAGGVQQPHKQISSLAGLVPDATTVESGEDLARLTNDHFLTGTLPASVGALSQVLPMSVMALAALPAAGGGALGQALGNALVGGLTGYIFADPGKREEGATVGAGTGAFLPYFNKGLSALEAGFTNFADDMALKASGAGTDLINSLRDKFGSPRAAGHVIRTMDTPGGTPVIPALARPETRLNNVEAVSDQYGPIIGALRRGVDEQTPGAVSVDDIIDRALGVASKSNTAPERVFNAARTPRMIEKMVDAFQKETRAKATPTGTNVEYPPPPQGNLPLSTMERPAPIGQTRAPDTVVPPGEPVQTGLGLPTTSTVATGAVTRETPAPTLVLDRNGSPMISRQGIGATVPGTKTAYSKGSRVSGEVEGAANTLPVKVESEQLGAIRAANAAEGDAQATLDVLRAAPRGRGNLASAYAADDAATAARAQSDLVSSADDAGFIRDPQLRRNRLEDGLTTPRPTDETGYRPALNQEPDVTVASEIGYQPSLFSGYEIPPAPTAGATIPGEATSTELARQLRMGARGANAFPPQGPVEPVSTNFKYTPKRLSVEDTAAFKKWLDDLVLRKASINNPNKPHEAIQLDPKLRALRDLGNVFRTEEDAAMLRGASPEDYSAYVQALRRYGNAQAFEPAIRGSANRHAGATEGASEWGIRRLLMPAAGMSAGGAYGGGTGALAGLAVGTGAEVLASASRTHGYPILSRLGGATARGLGNVPQMSFVKQPQDPYSIPDTGTLLETLLRQR